MKILMLTCDRPETLALALRSWAAVRGIAAVPFVVSSDCRSGIPAIEKLLRQYRRHGREAVTGNASASGGGGQMPLLELWESFQIDVEEVGAQRGHEQIGKKEVAEEKECYALY